MPLSREFDEPPLGLSPGMIGFADCGGPLANVEKKRTITGEYSVRHFLGIQRSSENAKLGNAYWLPVLEDPADGLAKSTSDMAPHTRLVESGATSPGIPRPLRDVSPKKDGGARFLLRCPPFFLLDCEIYISACWSRGIWYFLCCGQVSGFSFSYVLLAPPFIAKWRRTSLNWSN